LQSLSVKEVAFIMRKFNRGIDMEIFKESKFETIPKRLQYGAKEAGFLLSVSERTVRGMIKTGKMPSHKLGGKRFITHENLMKFVSGSKAGGV
jgi:excisionase family DNA binding protein